MFFATRLVGAAALLSGFAAALPQVVPVSGAPISATQTATTSATSTASVNYGSSGNSGSGWASQTQAWSTATALATASVSYNSSGKSGSGWASQAWTTKAWTTQAWTTQTWTTATSLVTAASSAPSYGSGGSSWGNQNYNSCVQQCVASFGGSSTTYTPPTATSVSGSGSSGSGATHTVIVAPTQGVLRFVPFAVNASVGDTIQFSWGANNHTVTKSSALTPCNKTSSNPFSSGEQNQTFVFTQVVNDTNPTFFYCGTPTHCDKGMFGIINPPNAFGSSTSASSMMQPLIANNATFGTYANYTNLVTAGSAAAAGWGGSIDMGVLPTWAHSYAAENIMYTRNFLALNSEVLQKDGSVNLGSGSTSLTYPRDISTVNSTGPTSSATLPSISSSPSPLPSASLGSSASTSSAAISTSSSKVLLGIVVGFATFMMF